MRPPRRSAAIPAVLLGGLLAVALLVSGCAVAKDWLEAHEGECPYGYLELARGQGYGYAEVCPPPYRSELDGLPADGSGRQAVGGADGSRTRNFRRDRPVL